MHGSGSLCLLAISVLILAPVMLNGQSDRRTLSHDFAPPVSSRVTQPLVGETPPIDRFPAPPRAPVTTPGTVDFPLLARAAGMIFSGRVIAVARRAAIGGQSVETVAITFHIENAIRGATPGEDLTISQWIGLWSGGQRYRIGDRVLLFLYPRSKLGLTSSVGGAMGRFSVDPLGRVLLSAQHVSSFQANPILARKSRATLRDFAQAVRRASPEE